MGGMEVVMVCWVRPFWRMGGMSVAVQEWYKSINFGVWGGMEVVMLLLVRPFWRMRGKVAAYKNMISSILEYGWHGGSGLIGPSILAYGWHGGSDDLIRPSILAYGWHGGRVQECYKSIYFGIWVAWRSSARTV
jgi:hypothetical protein